MDNNQELVGITNLDNDVFSFNNGRLVFKKGVTRMPKHFIQDYPQLVDQIQEVDFSQSNILTIEEYSFCECSKLQNVIFNDKINKIKREAFASCVMLNNVELPVNLTNIADFAFSHCEGLTNLKFNEKLKTMGIGVFEYTGIKNIKLPDTLRKMDYGVFSGCADLYKVEFGKMLNYIPHSAFYGCISLDNVFIPNLVTTIEDYAFYDCINLRYIKLGENLSEIKESAFENCVSLRKVNIPDSVKEIGVSAFTNCQNLFYIKLSEKLVDIDDCAFMNCSSLRSVVMPFGLRRIGEFAFCNCEKLNTAKLNPYLQILGSYAFANTNVHSVTFPDTMQQLGVECFKNCMNLVDFKIPVNSQELMERYQESECNICDCIENKKLDSSFDGSKNLISQFSIDLFKFIYKHYDRRRMNFDAENFKRMTIVDDNTVMFDYRVKMVLNPNDSYFLKKENQYKKPIQDPQDSRMYVQRIFHGRLVPRNNKINGIVYHKELDDTQHPNDTAPKV